MKEESAGRKAGGAAVVAQHGGKRGRKMKNLEARGTRGEGLEDEEEKERVLETRRNDEKADRTRDGPSSFAYLLHYSE